MTQSTRNEGAVRRALGGRDARMPLRAHRGAILHFLDDPGDGLDEPGTGLGEASGRANGPDSGLAGRGVPDQAGRSAATAGLELDRGGSTHGSCFEYFADGVLLVEAGRIAALGPAAQLLPMLPASVPVITHRDRLLLPGFIDAHIHYPQTDIIGAAGHRLLEWLERCTYPAERTFADAAHARAVANFFLDELLRNGTTSACVFGTVHRASVEAFFEAAAARRLRMIAGKALMDRGPDGLRDTPESGDRDTRELIERWAGCGRLEYAITPRFAPGSSPEQLRRAGALARDFPRMLIQSHLAESREEVALARRLFPEARSYLDVYDRFGLVRARAIYAHCIHLDEADRRRMAQAGAAAAFCPSSNLFLGSGLFDIEAADAADLKFSVATDVGAGTSFSLLRTLGDAYKVARLSGRRRTAQRARSASTRTSAISIPARRRTSSSSTSLRRRSSPGACAPHAASPTSSPCS